MEKHINKLMNTNNLIFISMVLLLGLIMFEDSVSLLTEASIRGILILTLLLVIVEGIQKRQTPMLLLSLHIFICALQFLALINNLNDLFGTI